MVAHRRGEMPLQMPLCVCKCPYARPNAPRYTRKCPALAGGGTQMPLYTRENAPTCPAGNNPLVFDLPVRVSVLEPPIIPQNAPIRRGNNAPICTMPRYVCG